MLKFLKIRSFFSISGHCCISGTEECCFTIILIIRCRHKWSILFSILLFYEIVEISMLYVSLNVFLPETIKDQFTDLFVGMSGGYLFDKWLHFYSTNKKQVTTFFRNPNTHIALFTAISIAFDWVGFYRYKYNMPILDSFQA